MARPTPRAGFTLVEMLVALFLFGLIAAAGVTMLSFTLSSQEAVRGRLDRVAELSRLRAALAADVSQAATRAVRRADGGRAAPFAVGGDPGAPLLAFVRRGRENLDGAPRPSLQRVVYALEDDRLVRRAAAALDGAPDGPPATLLTGVRRATVCLAASGTWRPAPDEALETLPDGVRLELVIDGLGAVEIALAAPSDGYVFARAAPSAEEPAP